MDGFVCSVGVLYLHVYLRVCYLILRCVIWCVMRTVGLGCLLVANGLLDLANGIGLYYFMWFRSFKYAWLV